MTGFLQDLRIACRAISKNRGFAATAVLTLGLGMTLCTTAIVATKAYLLQELPYPSSDRLYSVRYGDPGGPQPAGMEALDWESLSDVIAHPIAWDLDAFYMLGGEHAEMVPGAWITPGFVQGLGISPALGRGFDAPSFAPGSENVVLISNRLWQRRFGGDPAIVGRTFTAYVSDRPAEAERFRVIGVLPAGFWHINTYTEIFAPLRARTFPYLVQLRPGVTPQQVTARIASLVRAGARDVPSGWQPVLVRAQEQYVERLRPMLWTASAAATLVLVVACANVAALLLVRAVRRQKEVAVRTALGASRAAIARMLLAEALILGLSAATFSVGATAILVRWFAPTVQMQLGRTAPGGAEAFAIDSGTLAFAAIVGLLTAIFCTLVPLLTSTRPAVQGALQSSGRSATEGPASRRLRSTLIAAEVALSLILLAGSTLMLRSVVALLNTDLGIAAERVLMSSITLRQNRYPDAAERLAALERIESRLTAIPGVEAVGLTTAWPLQQPRMAPVRVPGGESGAAQAGLHRINAQYFATMGIEVAAGRAFSSDDRQGSEGVAVVSEALARRLWPGDAAAVGRRIVVPEEQEGAAPASVERLVVGIVRNVRQGPADAEGADLYLPVAQLPVRSIFVLARTAGDPTGWLASYRSAFRDVDPEISVQTARPLATVVDELTARPRFLTSLLGGFAVVAALLALIGVYGVIAYAVRQREREIAVRMALGADPSLLTRHFVRQGSRVLVAGLALGVIGAMASGRVIEAQLFGVTPRDPLALLTATAAFAFAGLVAIWWPSRRAAATDPAVALRQD